MNKRAVLYARVSGDDRGKDGRNLQGQLEMCREYAEEHGWHVVAELAEDDRGASGASFDLPKLNQALEMARAGEVDVLVVREMDRLSRSLAKQLIVEEGLKRNGVKIAYVLGDYPDTPEGNLMKHVKASVVEYDRLKIVERLSRGRRLSAQAGNVLVAGRPPYGYRVVEKDGKTTLEICESEAQIIRLVYTWYTEGDGERGPMGLGAIAGRLTMMHVPTSFDTGTRKNGKAKVKGYGEWGRAAIQRMIKNETYAGLWHYGKRNGRKKKPNLAGHTLAVEVPAIVTREMWEAAQERRAYNRRYYRREPKYQYLLGRRVACGECGLKMKGSSALKKKGGAWLYYRCPARSRDYARHCTMSLFRADVVDSAVWDWLKEKLSDPERLAQGFEKYGAEQDRVTEPIRVRLAVVESLAADNQKRLEKLLDLYLAGDFPKEMLTERKARLEATIDALSKERAGLTVQLEAQTLTDEQKQSIQDFAARVRAGIEDADFQTRRGVIESLDVTVTLAVEDGQKVAYPRCVLPGGQDALPIDTHHKYCETINRAFVLTARLPI